MGIIKFVKKWTLPCAMVFGACVYLLFAEIPLLEPIGTAVGPYVADVLPPLIFLTLYSTFCKIRLHDLRFHAWHAWMQLIRLVLAVALVVAAKETDGHGARLVIEGAFACVICPTASAAAVVTEKLDGDLASMTVYTLLDNGVTAVLVPLLFPMLEQHADMAFLSSFATIIQRTAVILVLPFCCAMATRKWLPKLAGRIKAMRNLAFYFWAVNLSIVMGLTLHSIFTATVPGLVLLMLIAVPAVVTIVLFAIGKRGLYLIVVDELFGRKRPRIVLRHERISLGFFVLLLLSCAAFEPLSEVCGLHQQKNRLAVLANRP